MSATVVHTDTPARNADALVTRYAPLVKRIAYHMVGRLPSSVQVEDLIQTGLMGLLEAAQRFDASHGASFETYAGIRIRGYMLDEVRRSGWTPRSVRRKARRISAAMRTVEQAQGREAHAGEVAAALGIELDEFYTLQREAAGFGVLSISELSSDDDDDSWLERVANHEPGPQDEVLEQELRNRIAAAITNLPQREQLVMSLYYEADLNLREIGAVLGVTESRVCQIHSQAVLRLRREIAAADA